MSSPPQETPPPYSLCGNIAQERNDNEMPGISRRLNFSESRNSLASSEEQLSSRTVSLNSDTSSPEGPVGSDGGSASSSTITLSHSNSHSTLSTNSSDTASTASLHDSDIMDGPQNTWENLGLVELETPARPRQRRRLNTSSTDVSTRSYLNSPRVSYSSGCHTPVTDSD